MKWLFNKLHILFPVFLCLCFPVKAYAYLDPGTGSYMLQMLAATLLGALYALKIYWSRLKAFIRDLFSKDKKDDSLEN